MNEQIRIEGRRETNKREERLGIKRAAKSQRGKGGR